MAWAIYHQIGNKPLPEPMLTKFYDTMMSLAHDELKYNDCSIDFT